MSDLIRGIANNRAAYHEYFVEDKFEAGIELFGTEVKSLRAGNVNLKDSYCWMSSGRKTDAWMCARCMPTRRDDLSGGPILICTIRKHRIMLVFNLSGIYEKNNIYPVI